MSDRHRSQSREPRWTRAQHLGAAFMTGFQRSVSSFFLSILIPLPGSALYLIPERFSVKEPVILPATPSPGHLPKFLRILIAYGFLAYCALRHCKGLRHRGPPVSHPFARLRRCPLWIAARPPADPVRGSSRVPAARERKIFLIQRVVHNSYIHVCKPAVLSWQPRQGAAGVLYYP